MKTKIEIHPSFLNPCYLEITNQQLTIEIKTRSSDSNTTGKWHFDIAERDSKKIAALTHEIIKESKNDQRIILDGVSLRCSIQTNDIQKEYTFRCPEANTPELELVLSYLTFLEEQKLDDNLNDYLELLEGYFIYRLPVKEFNEDTYRVRIYGSLSIYEKNELTDLLSRVASKNQSIIIDMRNSLGMGTALYSCFEPLKRIAHLEILVNEAALKHVTDMGFETSKIKLTENL